MPLFPHASVALALCMAASITFITPGAAWTQTSVRNGDTFGNWIFECIALDESQTACGLSQTIVANDGNSVLAKITFGREAETNDLILSTLLPLSLDLTHPIALQADARSIGIVILSCVPSGCFGRSVLSAEDAIALAETSGLSISLKGFSEEGPAIIPASAEGLGEGMERVNYISSPG